MLFSIFSSGKSQYLEAALNGMKPFSISSGEGGVRAYFMNQYPWYEEYPSMYYQYLIKYKGSSILIPISK